MRKRTALRPAVDALECRLALSQMTQLPTTGGLPDGGNVEMTTLAASATISKSISGKLVGNVSQSLGHTIGMPDVGHKFTLTGSGHVKTLGMVQVKGSVGATGFIQNGKSTGELTLTNSKGTLTLGLTGPPQAGFSSLPSTYQFAVTGGTGAYSSTSGQGTLTATWKPSASGPRHFHFTLSPG